LGEIDSGTSTHAAWLANNLANVEAWRRTLTDKERISLNHPTALWRRHPDGRKTEKEDAPSRIKRPGQAVEIDNATRRAYEMLDYHELRRGPDLAELLDLSPEHVEASADNFIDIFGEEAARRFFAVLQRRFAPKPEPEQPVDAAFAKSLAKPKRQRKAAKIGPQLKEPASV
jgi:hypothetical protein